LFYKRGKCTTLSTSLPPSLSLSQNPEKQEKMTNAAEQNTVLPFGLFETIQTSFDNYSEQYSTFYFKILQN